MKKGLRFATGLAVLGMVVGLSGCSSTDKKEEGSKKDGNGKTELAVSVWGYDANPEFKAMFSAFEKENPDVSIKVVDIAADQYENKITTMLAGGDTTDVLAIKGVGSYVNYANKGQLVDLTKKVEGLSAEVTANYNDNLAGYKMEDGKYFAMPFRKDINMLFYNKGLFDKAGVAYPSDLTWEEYEKLAEKMTQGEGEGKVYGSYHHVWYPLLQATAANQTDNDLLAGNYGFLEEYYDRNVRMQDKGYVMDYATIKTTSTTYASVFENEKTSMMIMGSFYLGKLINAAKEGRIDLDWAVTDMPQQVKGESKTYGGPTGFSVSNHSKNQELATKFVEFCSGEAGAIEVAKIGMTTAYQSDAVMDVLYKLEGMPQDEGSKKALKPEFSGWELLPRGNTATINDILAEEHDLMMVEDLTVKDGIAEITKRVKTEVDE